MTDGERSILIVVPRNGHETCRSLSHTFADDSTVQVIVDRRTGNRRARADTAGSTGEVGAADMAAEGATGCRAPDSKRHLAA